LGKNNDISGLKIRKDISGMVFRNLTAIKPSYKVRNQTYWECLCICGNTHFALITKLISGEVGSCGCYKRAKAKSDSTIHGLFYHPLHSKWKDMLNRCYNKNASSYHLYGERGVTVCEEWKNSFLDFYNWAISNGWEKGLQLDKDKKGNGFIYSPNSCCFLTSKENNNNRRNNRYVIYEGERLTIAQWSEKLGISRSILTRNLDKGFSVLEILNKYKNKK